MRIAILSDIHGNLEALQACLNELDKLRPDKVYCLGDIVGYGANPEECVNIVAQAGWQSVLGNHDAAVIDPSEMTPMNPMARQALEWTAQNLSDKAKDFLKSLPLKIPISDDAIASHGLPHKPSDWLYSDDPYAVLNAFLQVPAKVMFVGHLHYAHSYKYEKEEGKLMLYQLPESLDLSEGRYIVNVGSVGQPRDDDHRACLVIFDDAIPAVIYHRIQYDTALAAKKIVDAGLPDILAQRLFLGR